MSELHALHIHVASFNTHRATELCVRSLHRYAGHPFHLVVGDSGSTDGSVEILGALQRAGWLELQRSPEQWHHSDWLDHWLTSSPAGLAVFCDSDIEFLEPEWLSRFVAHARDTGASLVTAEMLPEHHDFIEPVGHRRVRLRSRPAPWLMLVDLDVLRSLGVGFSFHAQECHDVDEGFELYDVGGWLHHQLLEKGFTSAVMPDSYGRAFRHYRGLSWRKGSGMRRLRSPLLRAWIGLRLQVLRLGQRRPSPQSHG